MDSKLETERFDILEIDDSDINHIYKGLSHPNVIEYYGVSFHSLEATKEQMEWYRNLKDEEKGIWWKVISKNGGTFVGAGGYNDWDKTNHKAEIGFWLLPEYWGKGIMKEVMELMIGYAFDTMHLNRIEGFVDSGNLKCKKALDKVGFLLEGTMREVEKKNGKYLNVDIYSKLKRERT